MIFITIYFTAGRSLELKESSRRRRHDALKTFLEDAKSREFVD